MSKKRDTPRISLNKLGEYMTATPGRRKTIIADQKKPRTFMVARYTDAQEVIAQYVEGGALDDEMLLEAIERLNTAPVSGEWEEQSNQLCSLAIGHFLAMKDNLDLSGCRCEALTPEQPATINIAGVDVSIRPELSLIVEGTKKHGYGGAIKLAFSKTYKLGEKSGEYVTTLLHEYASQVLHKDQKVWNEKCLLIDVFDRQIMHAPTARRRRMDDIVAACEEIKRMW